MDKQRHDAIRARCEKWNKLNDGTLAKRVLSKALAREDIPYLLDEKARLESELAAMTAERDAALQHNRRVSSLPNCNDCRDAKSCEHIAPWGEMVRFNCPLWRGPREAPQ